MLPFPDCPLKQQLGLGQVRVDCLLRFIHVCCQKTIRKSSWNHVLRGCWIVGESQQHFPEEAPVVSPETTQEELQGFIKERTRKVPPSTRTTTAATSGSGGCQ